MAIAYNAAPTPAVQSSPADEAARTYINALIAGQKPADRPATFGRWDTCITSLEKAFKISKGNGQAVANMLENLIQSKRYPGLKELMTEQPDDLDRPNVPVLPEFAQLLEHLSRGACPTMEDYIAYSKLVSPEGYEDFHWGSFLWLLSTIAGRRIKIPLSRKQYTPLMIAFVSRTSLYAKTETADVGSMVLSSCGLDWMLGADETTPSRLLSDMRGSLAKDYLDLSPELKEIERKRLGRSGQIGWVYDEFGQLIESMNNKSGVMQAFKGLILKLDKCADKYTPTTQARGAERIDKPYLALLGCMTPSDMSGAKRGSRFWTDGFWARFAFICAPKHGAIDAPFGLGEIPVPERLKSRLKAWHDELKEPVCEVQEIYDEKTNDIKIQIERGELPEQTIQFGAGVYDAWVRYRSGLKAIIKDWKTYDLDGSYVRLAIKALRIAALIASLENHGTIEMQHWALAQELAEKMRVSLHELYEQANNPEEEATKEARAEDKILELVQKLEAKQGPPSANELKDYLKSMDRVSIDKMCKALAQTGKLKSVQTKRTTRYSFVEEEQDE